LDAISLNHCTNYTPNNTHFNISNIFIQISGDLNSNPDRITNSQ